MPSVFGTLLRNEMRGFFRSKIAAFWSFIFPLFLFAVLYLAYGGDSLAPPQQAALSYGQYLLGGVLVMMMMSTGIMSTATVLAVMREHNVFRIYGCLPVPRTLFLLAIIAVRLALIVTFSSAMLLAGKYLFGIGLDLSPPRLLWWIVLIVCGGTLFLSLGVLLGARVATVATATVLTNAVYFPLLFLGDLTFPLKALPEVAQHALALVPVNQLATGLRTVLFQAPDAGAMGRLVAVLLGGSMLLVAVAARTFRWGR